MVKVIKKHEETEEEKNSEFKKLLTPNHLKALPKVGEIIEGEVIDMSPNAVHIDINGITTGVIRGTELFDESGEFSNLAIGDQASATVLDLENEMGEMELSFRHAGHEKAWENLKALMETQEVIPVTVINANKGGLMVKYNKIGGFLPVSQLSPEHYPRVEGGSKNKILEKLKQFINKKLTVKIIDVSKDEKKLIVSERETSREAEKEILANYKVGDVVEGEISGVVDFGAFFKFADGMEGLIHLSELAWQRIDHPRDIVAVGQKMSAKIISIDGSKVSFSLKQLLDDPWKEASQTYKVGQKVTGKILKINPFGLFVELDEKIHGLCHVSEITPEISKKLNKEINPNDSLEFKILSLEPGEHRLGLSIKALKEKPKAEEGENKDSEEVPFEETPKKVKKTTKKKTEETVEKNEEKAIITEIAEPAETVEVTETAEKTED